MYSIYGTPFQASIRVKIMLHPDWNLKTDTDDNTEKWELIASYKMDTDDNL